MPTSSSILFSSHGHLHQRSRYLRTWSDIATEWLYIPAIDSISYYSVRATSSDVRHNSRHICFLWRAFLAGCNVKCGEYSRNHQPHARVGEETARAPPCSETKCGVRVSRCVWGEPAFWIELVWFREYRRIVHHSPRIHYGRCTGVCSQKTHQTFAITVAPAGM
jgi:hypothetical protein